MDVRSRVLELVVTPHEDTRFGTSYLPLRIAQECGCQPYQVQETLWRLVADGLIYLDPGPVGQGPDNWRWLPSAAGIRAAQGGAWEPDDREGFLRRLRRQAPDLDPIAFRYMEEALGAFNARCYLATVVMLGVAAEKVFLALAEAVGQALGPEASKLRDALDNPRASQHTRFLELRKVLESWRSRVPGDLANVLTLDAVSEMLRVSRNEAGHPTGQDIDEGTGRTLLLISGDYLAKMTELRKHFDEVAATSGP
jgi:hypothetical protein